MSQASSAAEFNKAEPHLKISEIAEQWNVSYDTARRLFMDEPGVLKIGEPSRLLKGRNKKYKRGYAMLRVPRAVFLRVQDRLMHKRGPDSAVVVPAGGGVRDLHAG